jgi:hypothetical protein
VNAVTELCFALVVVVGAAPCAAVSAQVGAAPRGSGPDFPATAIGRLGRGLIEAINTFAGKPARGHGGGGPGSGISSELGWFTDGSYTAIVLGNYDVPGSSAIYRKLMEVLAAQ